MKRKLIKISCVFVVIMVFLTITSRVTNNMTLAKVSTVLPEANVIVQNVNTSGVVSTDKEVSISVAQGLTIDGISVSTGEAVKKGDTLLTVNAEQLNAKVTQLQNLISSSGSAQELARQRAQEDYNMAVSEREKSVQKAFDVWKSAVDVYNAYLEDKENFEQEMADQLKMEADTANEGYTSAIESGDASVLAAKRTLEDANLPSGEADTSAQDEKLLEKLKALQKQGGKITAPNSGIIREILASNGEETTGQKVMSLSNAAESGKITITLTEEEKKIAPVGTKVFASGVNEKGKEKYSDSLKIDALSANAEDKKLWDATINIPKKSFGVGTEVTIEITKESKMYRCCLPIDVLRKDSNNQYFVLVPETRQGILGEELIAKRVDVQVLEKNWEYAAVEDWTFESDQKIIVKATRDIEDGSKIKLQEE